MIRTGPSLKEDLATLEVQHTPLVEGLLYERHVSFIAGEPGGGKSILAMQTALALSSGTPVFGSLSVPKPRRVYYLQLEGSYPDTIDRMRRMQQRVPIDPQNLIWDFRKGLNLLDLKESNTLLADLAAYAPIDLLILDPLYQAVFGELAGEMPTKALVRFVDTAREHLAPCAILLIHHTKKPSTDREGKKVVEDDPFYGSQWLKAYVDSSYILKKGTGKYTDHVFLMSKKDRYSVSAKQLLLHYDPETDTVSTDIPEAEQSPYERVVKYLSTCKREGRTTHFFEVADATKISVRHLRRLIPVMVERGLLRVGKYEGHKRLWHPDERVPS